MLTLPIKKKWFDMILSGEKKEEYRELNDYYKTRLENLFVFQAPDYQEDIIFRNGYSANSPQLKALCSLSIGYGKSEWGAEPGEMYHVLTIHQVKKLN